MIFNLCGPDDLIHQIFRRAGRQTDRRADDMQSQYRALPNSALRGNNTFEQ